MSIKRPPALPRQDAPSPEPGKRWLPAGGQWLVADIGGTYSRFASWTAGKGLAHESRRIYRNDEFPDLAAVVNAYRRDVDSSATQALLAIASPIGRRVSLPMTNRRWSIDLQALKMDIKLRRLDLVNDLAAAAAGIAAVDASEIEATQAACEEASPKLVIGVGTGLGAAIVLTDQTRIHVLASEAGHMTAAVDGPVARRASDLAARLHGRVSWERLLSGEGLTLFDAAVRGGDQADPPEKVAARALDGEANATHAAQAFGQALGQFAGDLCLAACAWGGVYFTGGVLKGLGSAFDLGVVRPAFESKGRLSARLESVPLMRVLARDLAERGLDRLLAGAADAPIVEA